MGVRVVAAGAVVGLVAITLPAALLAQGPRVSAAANYRTAGAARVVDASFRLRDDGYVVVAHLGADGAIQIVYPEDPNETGFRRGGARYSVPRFSAGWESDYRWRREVDLRFEPYRVARHQSYDGGTGFLFVIASHRPLRLHAYSRGGIWDALEVTDADYRRDPLPVIDAFAADIAGARQYTLHFVHALNESQYQFAFGSAYSYGSPRFGCAHMSAFVARWHSPYVVIGFGSTPWWYGSHYTIRPAYYDPFTGCVYRRGYGPVHVYHHPWAYPRPIVWTASQRWRYEPPKHDVVEPMAPRRPVGVRTATPAGVEPAPPRQAVARARPSDAPVNVIERAAPRPVQARPVRTLETSAPEAPVVRVRERRADGPAAQRTPPVARTEERPVPERSRPARAAERAEERPQPMGRVQERPRAVEPRRDARPAARPERPRVANRSPDRRPNGEPAQNDP